MESILTSIKKLLGIEEEDTSFDKDIVIYINSVLFNLNQIAVGPTEGFSITSKTETWENFLGTRKDLEAVKTYVYLKVRLMFDPPQSSFLVDAIKTQVTELEWRINVQAEFQ
jgi:hypothetical protein